jgi:hypothetical protein
MRDLIPILNDYLIAKSKGDAAAWEAKLWAVKENTRFSGKVRDQRRLFVTDLAKCPRAIKYRLNGETQYPPTTAKRLMFEQAEDIETTVAAACKWADILLDYQKGVDLSDRENWGGRKDITLIDPLTVEVKSSRSAAFKGDKGMPKEAHREQVGIYHHYDGTTPCLLYMDRGGENMPRQYEVEPLYWPDVSARMDELDDLRESADLPDPLPLVLSRKAARKSEIDLGGWSVDWSGEIWLGPDWRCNYCDYDICEGGRRQKTMLAKMTKKDPLVLSGAGKAHEDYVYRYLRSGQRELSLCGVDEQREAS